MALTWHGNEFFSKNRKDLGDRLERAAIFLENEVKKNLSEKCKVIKTGGGRNEHGQFVAKTEHREHSPAGGFPFLESGELRRSITHEVDREALVARVGTNKVYGRYLEKSTSKMEARPFCSQPLKPTSGR